MSTSSITILGIETSCDETAAAVYSTSQGVLSHTLFSQTDLQALYGGTVPEIASRSHMEKIEPIITQALVSAQVQLTDLDAIAVTSKPGLPGSLLVGLSFAKAIAFATNTPIIGVDHLEGHIFSACLEHTIPFPFLCLSVSGGHTALYHVRGYGDYTLLGQTLDDAAGEALDKVAKMMQLPYPGGPILEQYGMKVAFKDFYHYPRGKKSSDFSFSGLKTAVLYDLVDKGAYVLADKKFLAHDDELLKQRVASSLYVCLGDIFTTKVTHALKQTSSNAFVFVGGVACNTYLRRRLQQVAHSFDMPFFVPSPEYCIDNAAMIAYVGAYKYRQGKTSTLALDIFESV